MDNQKSLLGTSPQKIYSHRLTNMVTSPKTFPKSLTSKKQKNHWTKKSLDHHRVRSVKKKENDHQIGGSFSMKIIIHQLGCTEGH